MLLSKSRYTRTDRSFDLNFENKKDGKIYGISWEFPQGIWVNYYLNDMNHGKAIYFNGKHFFKNISQGKGIKHYYFNSNNIYFPLK